MPIFYFSLLFCDVLFWTLRKIIRRTIILLKGKNNKSVRSTCHLKKPKEKIANQELAKIADDGSEDWLENDETVNLGEIWSRFANCAAHFGSQKEGNFAQQSEEILWLHYKVSQRRKEYKKIQTNKQTVQKQHRGKIFRSFSFILFYEYKGPKPRVTLR